MVLDRLAARLEAAAAGQLSHRRVDHAAEEAALEGLAEVAHAVELGLAPAGLEALGVAGQAGRAGVAGGEGIGDRLGREHAGVDRQVHALEALHVHEAGRVADQHEAVALELGHREVAAAGDRLGAVAQDLAALEALRDRRVLLPVHEHGVRVEPRVVVIQADHVADRQAISAQAVDPAAAVAAGAEGRAHGMDDLALELLADLLGDLPDLLDAGLVQLVVLAGVEAELLDQALGQAAAGALGEDGHAGGDVHARLEGRLLVAVLVDARVAGLHADDALAVLAVAHAGHGEARVDLDAELLGAVPQPAGDAVEGDDEVAVVLQRRRGDRQLEGATARLQVLDPVVADDGLDGEALVLVVREQIGDAARVHDRAGQAVGAHVLALLEHQDRALLALLLTDLGQADGGGEPGGAGADDDHVDLELLALDVLGVEAELGRSSHGVWPRSSR